MKNYESFEYQPTAKNLNDELTVQQREDLANNIRVGHDGIPVSFDPLGDMVQADKPMPEDEFEQARREINEL